MKYFALFGVILFVLFAIVQVNDPDPYIWVPVYLFPASLSFLVYKGRYPIMVLGATALLCLLFSVMTFPPSLIEWVMDELNNGSLSMKTASMEEGRESLGVLIAGAFLSSYIFHFYWLKKGRLKIS